MDNYFSFHFCSKFWRFLLNWSNLLCLLWRRNVSLRVVSDYHPVKSCRPAVEFSRRTKDGFPVGNLLIFFVLCLCIFTSFSHLSFHICEEQVLWTKVRSETELRYIGSRERAYILRVEVRADGNARSFAVRDERSGPSGKIPQWKLQVYLCTITSGVVFGFLLLSPCTVDISFDLCIELRSLLVYDTSDLRKYVARNSSPRRPGSAASRNKTADVWVCLLQVFPPFFSRLLRPASKILSIYRNFATSPRRQSRICDFYTYSESQRENETKNFTCSFIETGILYLAVWLVSITRFLR